VLDKVGVPDGI